MLTETRARARSAEVYGDAGALFGQALGHGGNSGRRLKSQCLPDSAGLTGTKCLPNGSVLTSSSDGLPAGVAEFVGNDKSLGRNIALRAAA